VLSQKEGVEQMTEGRMRMVGMVGFVLVLLLSACGSSEQDLNGIVTLFDGIESGVRNGAEYCTGEGGYSNIQGGANVTILDGSGTIIGVSTLDAGQGSSQACAFDFSAEVKDADFYTVEVGGRGRPTYSRENLEAQDWVVILSLG
jgi:hypothetical protein